MGNSPWEGHGEIDSVDVVSQILRCNPFGNIDQGYDRVSLPPAESLVTHCSRWGRSVSEVARRHSIGPSGISLIARLRFDERTCSLVSGASELFTAAEGLAWTAAVGATAAG
jgi:hypothetical protein